MNIKATNEIQGHLQQNLLESCEMRRKILNCNLCSSPDSNVLWVENGIKVVKCKHCGFSYSQTLSTRVFERKDNAEAVFVESERKKRVYSQVLKFLKGKKGGSLIDVGCRTGNFMLCCRREGFERVVGVEISEKFAKFAAGLQFKVFNCRLQEAALPEQSFDIVTYLETLEHISTPVNELTEAYRILKNDGIIVVEVPNLTFQLFKAKVSRFFHIGHFGLMPHNHLVQFTDTTIRAALAKAGFKTIRTTQRVHYIQEGLPLILKVFSVVFHCFAKLVRQVSGLTISSAIIAIARKSNGPN